MPIASIDVRCQDGMARVSFNPHLPCERFVAFSEQLGHVAFADLCQRLREAAGDWQVEVDIQLLAN